MKQNTAHSWKALLLIAWLGLAGFAAPPCRAGGPPPYPVRLAVILDGSGSVSQDQRRLYCRFLLPIVRAAIGRADFDFFVFDSNVRMIGSPDLRSAPEFIGLMEREYLGQPLAQGTYFSAVSGCLSRESDQAARNKQRLVVICLTDAGFNDTAQLASLARPLAHCQCLSRFVIGPCSYQRCGSGGTYYDVVQRDLGCDRNPAVDAFPNDPKLAADTIAAVKQLF